MSGSRYRPFFYICLVLVISWIVQTLLFLGMLPVPVVLYMFVPATLAFILFMLRDDRWKVQARLFTSGPVWKALAFGALFPLGWFTFASIIAVLSGAGKFNAAFLPTLFSWSFISTLLLSALMFLPSGFGEEYGWRGYLQPALEGRYSRTVATLIVGVVWASWHIPSYFIAYTKADMGNPYLLTLLGMAVNVAVAFPYAYCWGLSRNVLPLVLMHAVHDICAQMLYFGTPAVPGLSEGSKALIDITYPAPLLMMLIAAALMIPVFIWLFRRTEAQEVSAETSGDTPVPKYGSPSAPAQQADRADAP